MNNAYSMTHENLIKIKTVLRYFTPNARKQIKQFFKSDDLVSAALNTDSKLFFLFIVNVLSKEEVAQFSKERLSLLGEQWKNKKNDLARLTLQENNLRLLNKNFTNLQICNQLLDDILTDIGCQTMSEKNINELFQDIKQLSDAIKKIDNQEELDKIFNDEEAQ
jgi:hypothetical protein